MTTDPTKNIGVPENEREKTVLFDSADSLSLEMEAAKERIEKMHREMSNLQSQLNLLNARDQQLHGKFAEFNEMFWIEARQECSEWLEMVKSKGWSVRIERYKPEGVDQTAVKLVAFNPAEEQMARIRQMIFNHGNENNNPPHD